MTKSITKVVLPVAGLGTRFLPATKASPKEMLPIVDKPLIQYAVEEAVKAGIKVVIFVTGRSKRSIPDHFDKAYELEAELERRGKTELLELVRGILPKDVVCVYIRQEETLGLGHAVLCAASVVDEQPFAVMLADDLIDAGHEGCLSQMVKQFSKHRCSLVGVEEVDPENTDQYGIIQPGLAEGREYKVEGIVEKPKSMDSPSSLGVVGRYILTPRIFDLLRATPRGVGGEIQLTDAMAALLNHEYMFAYRFKGKRYDCGSKLGYLQATVEYALKHPELGSPFRDYLHSIIGQEQS